MNIEVGQGFRAVGLSGRVFHGLIIAVSNKNVEWVPVIDSEGYGRTSVKAYDEVGANYARERNNVRLRSCPPPFSEIGGMVNYKGEHFSYSVAVADMANAKNMDIDIFRRKCRIVDGGVKVSDHDMERVFHHLWRDGQRERVGFDITELNLDDDYHGYQM